ncbi:MAG TPA: amidohydrolase family protein [Nitrososphaerales archaeon]|nr:amidohydrolase family protein [Nitrososphaerales archaeon]
MNQDVPELVIRNARIFTANEDDEQGGIIEGGYLSVSNGRIDSIGKGGGPTRARRVIDADCSNLFPGFVDCHTHLLEFAPEAIYHAFGKSQELAISAFALQAMSTGVTSIGEHNLGHPVIREYPSFYDMVAKQLPLNVKIARGLAVIGTDPMAVVSPIYPGRTLTLEDINDEMITAIARLSEFPGENLFLTATVANLPADKAPLSGKVILEGERLAQAIHLFHAAASRVGAHIEGSESMQLFADAGGDVIHHAHGLDEKAIDRISSRKTNLVMTPAAGTGIAPSSPEEVWSAYSHGVEVSLATDCCIPLHPGASWVDLPPGSWIQPEQFLKVISPAFKRLQRGGVKLGSMLKLITSNPAKIMGIEKEAGTIAVGKRADIVIAKGFPALDFETVDHITHVIKDGQLQVARQV